MAALCVRAVKRQGIIIVFAAAWALSGCFPYHYTITPPATGRVVDAQDGRGIASASVSITSETGWWRNRERVTEATTDQDGRFSVPAQKLWAIHWAQQEPYWPQFTLQVNAPRYFEYREEVITRGMSRDKVHMLPTGAERVGEDFSNVLVRLPQRP